MFHSRIHPEACACVACASPADRRRVRLQAWAAIALVVGLYAFALCSLPAIAGSFRFAR